MNGDKEQLALGLVLYQCLRHFTHLDEANAAIHCAAVRYSPITFRVAEQLELCPEGTATREALTAARRVVGHAGKYEEDGGR